ncbi:MAG: hypothetical protein ABI306_02810 [Caulobacteraceae bacterium]
MAKVAFRVVSPVCGHRFSVGGSAGAGLEASAAAARLSGANDSTNFDAKFYVLIRQYGATIDDILSHIA